MLRKIRRIYCIFSLVVTPPEGDGKPIAFIAYELYPVTTATEAIPKTQGLSNAWCQLLADALNSEFSGNCEAADRDSGWKRVAGY